MPKIIQKFYGGSKSAVWISFILNIKKDFDYWDT
jgi:hypothetical protein